MKITETITPIPKSIYRNKKKLMLIIGISLFIIIITIIILVMTLKMKSKGKKCDLNICDCNPNLPQCINNCNSCDCNSTLCNFTINIEHKLNEINIYDDYITKTYTFVFNDNYITNISLNEKSINTTSIGKYLLNVYKIDNSTSNNIYYAYAILLNLENKNRKIVFDIKNSNEDFPFIKFSFDSTGEIGELEIDENYDNSFIDYIYEFIEKIIPQINKSINVRRIDENINYGYEKNGNNIHFTRKEIKEIDGFNRSKQEKNIKAIFHEGKVKNAITNTQNLIKQKKLQMKLINI